MSWEEMSRKGCGCAWYMDDWNRQKEKVCEEHSQKQYEEKKKKRDARDLRVSTEEGRCLSCVKLDHIWFSEYYNQGGCTIGFCEKCKNIKINKLKSKYELSSLEDLVEIKNNNKIKSEYKKAKPNSRGTNTKTFELWVKNLLKV
ncbi:hypothetical protein [Mycoplasma marinum]|uniref:Uncharacterized protein n=1 Tax=Mycoplasma marinum TaxID=1937190 RepID=A0A4R0XTR9_9MOLU|nr:hypothetical protein [Mycoplasma marinum]TCG10241.1 hypothetical protein C4B24_05105 [Mycoplasma marinum]